MKCLTHVLSQILWLIEFLDILVVFMALVSHVQVFCLSLYLQCQLRAIFSVSDVITGKHCHLCNYVLVACTIVLPVVFFFLHVMAPFSNPSWPVLYRICPFRCTFIHRHAKKCLWEVQNTLALNSLKIA